MFYCTFAGLLLVHLVHEIIAEQFHRLRFAGIILVALLAQTFGFLLRNQRTLLVPDLLPRVISDVE
jgi:ABC-type enterochelin transport system permease subunit